MDQRPPPPQLPYSHSGPTSAFPRQPLPQTAPTTAAASNNSPQKYPAFSAAPPHQPHATAATTARYFDHQRHPSDPVLYPSSATTHYMQDGANPNPNHGLPPQGHSRHQSASSISSAPPAVNRTMPPSGSPSQQPPPGPQSQQQQQQQQQQQGQHSPPHQVGHYGLPPMPPPGPSRQSSAYPPGRELPSLNSITRTNSSGSSMSISAMLGGSLPALREPPQPPPQQSQQAHYTPSSSTPSSSAAYGPAIHASPRMHSTAADFSPFRRPQTPDQPRPYDPRGSSAASPQAGHYTPEVQRYGTPQYHRGPPQHEQGRDPRMPAHGVPPRPSSQPKSFSSAPPARAPDHGRPAAADDMYARRDDPMRPPAHPMEYNPERTGMKPMSYDERYAMERDREADQRERERRERTLSLGESGRPHPAHPDYGGAGPRSQQPYGPSHQDHRDPRDPRDHHDQTYWQRQAAYDPTRAPYEQSTAQPRHPDEQPTSGVSYTSHPAPAYSQPPSDRYPPHTHAQYAGPAPQAAGPPNLRYDASPQQQRLGPHHLQQQGPPPHPQQSHQMHQQLPPHRPRPHEEEHQGSMYGPQNPQISLEPSRSKSNEDSAAQHMQNRGHLAVQEMNRTKGRVSPLPQAVQGAQPQLPGPAAEPGIKSEFGRVFSGLGGGLSGLGVPNPVTSAPPASSVPFPGATRRDDAEPGVHDLGPDAAKGGNRGRRRKLKEEELREEDSAGRLTPGPRAKRPKTMPHHHQYDIDPNIILSRLSDRTNHSRRSHHHHHHHHHHNHAQDSAQAGHAAGTLMKAAKGARIPSPTTHDGAHHEHRHVHAYNHGRPSAKPAPSPMPVIPPKPKQIVNSKAVLESVAKKPRYHLGDVLYEPRLHPAKLSATEHLSPDHDVERSWSTTPKPLPLDRISGNENSTITVKVPRIHLTPSAMEELTARRALWGTEVYTDDSDVVAALIHGGWIRGEWDAEAGASLLDLDHGISGDGVVHQVRGEKRELTAEEREARIKANEADYLGAPPPTGPVFVREKRDLHVTLVILPRLKNYASTTRFGIQSREFGGPGEGGRRAQHDGLSFMVVGVRWVESGARTQSEVRGRGRRERMRRAMREVVVPVGGMNVEEVGRRLECGKEKERQNGERDGGGKDEGKGEMNGEVDKENRPAGGEDKDNANGDKAPEGVQEMEVEKEGPPVEAKA